MAIKKKPATKKPVNKDTAHLLVDGIVESATKFVEGHKKPVAFFIGAATTDVNDDNVASPMISFTHGNREVVGRMFSESLQTMLRDDNLEPMVGTAILHTISSNPKLLRAVTQALPLLSAIAELKSAHSLHRGFGIRLDSESSMQPVWVSTLLPTLTCWGGRESGHPIIQTQGLNMDIYELTKDGKVIARGTNESCFDVLLEGWGHLTVAAAIAQGFRIKKKPESAYPIIKKHPPSGHRQGTLCSSVTVDEINDILGFKSQVADKSEHDWSFKVQLEEGGDWHVCGIWDYYKNRWSIFGDLVVFETLFPNKVLNHQQRESV